MNVTPMLVTALRVLLCVVGALALLGAVLPGTRVQQGRFNRGPGLPMPRAGRVLMLIFGLVVLVAGLSCGRT